MSCPAFDSFVKSLIEGRTPSVEACAAAISAVAQAEQQKAAGSALGVSAAIPATVSDLFGR